MSNDYLWDKRGTDPEIERLEGLLSDLRYQPTGPPALPQKWLVFEGKRQWWKLTPVYTFAGIVIAVILVAVWMILPGDVATVSIQMRGSLPDGTKNSEQQTTLTERPDLSANKQFTPVADQPVKTVFVPERKRPVKSVVQAKAIVKRANRSFESLTSEEKYAYEQLKLALAITGSKLKSVSDTINRTED